MRLDYDALNHASGVVGGAGSNGQNLGGTTIGVGAGFSAAGGRSGGSAASGSAGSAKDAAGGDTTAGANSSLSGGSPSGTAGISNAASGGNTAAGGSGGAISGTGGIAVTGGSPAASGTGAGGSNVATGGGVNAGGTDGTVATGGVTVTGGVAGTPSGSGGTLATGGSVAATGGKQGKQKGGASGLGGATNGGTSGTSGTSATPTGGVSALGGSGTGGAPGTSCSSVVDLFPVAPITNTSTPFGDTDDAFLYVMFPPGFQFAFYGTPYQGIYLNTNGGMTFGAGDDWFTADVTFHDNPSIAVFWTDMDAAANGADTRPHQMSYQQCADRFIVNYAQLQDWFEATWMCSAIVNLFLDGRIEIQYGEVVNQEILVGIFDGTHGQDRTMLPTQAPFTSYSTIGSGVILFDPHYDGSGTFHKGELTGQTIVYSP